MQKKTDNSTQYEKLRFYTEKFKKLLGLFIESNQLTRFPKGLLKLTELKILNLGSNYQLIISEKKLVKIRGKLPNCIIRYENYE